MADTDIVEDELMRDPEPNDFSSAALGRKLGRAEKVLKRVNGRLTAIAGRFGNPPEPERPQLVAAIDALRVQVAELTGSLDAMDRIVRPR